MKQASDPHFSKNYAFIRTLLGVWAILCNLFLVWSLFFLSWGNHEAQPIPLPGNMLCFVPCTFGALLLLNLPFDWAGGYFLEKKAGRLKGGFVQWFLQWIFGGLSYAALQTLGGYLFAMWIFGYGFAPVIILLIPAILAAARIWQFYLIPGRLKQAAAWPENYERALKDELKKLKEPWPDDVYLYRSEDGSTLNGGRVGMGAHSRLMISDSSTNTLSTRELAILIMREERHLGWASGQKHFHYALGWGLLGVLLSVPGIALLEVSGISAWLWMLAVLSSWHALGLVVLSGIARRQVLKADKEMLKDEISKKEYISLLKKLQSKNRTAVCVLKISEILFHSMPSLQTRLNRLDRL